MELVQELFITAFVALIFSFFLAKLVSTATTGDSKRDLGLKESNDAVHDGQMVLVEEKKFDGGLRVQSSTRSTRKVRFADESVQKVDKFEAFDEKRCRSGQIEALGVPVGSTEGQSKAVETVGGVVGIKEVDDVADLGGLVVEEKAEGRVEVVEEVGGASEGELGREAAGMGGVGVGGIKDGGLVGNLDGLVVEREGSEGKVGDDVESVSIKEEGVMTSLDGLVVEREGNEGREDGDVGSVIIKEEGVVTSLDGLVVEEEGSEGKEGDGVETTKEGVVTSLDGLVVEEGGEGREADDVERVVKEGDGGTNWDGLGGKEGGERKEADDVNEGNEKEDAGDIGKRCERIKGDDIESENKEEGLVTDLDGLIDEEGGKEADDVESVVKEGSPMADLVFEGKIVKNADGDVGDVENVVKEGNEMDVLGFEGTIVENADAGCKIDSGSAIDDIAVAQDAKVSDVESGIEGGLNKGDVKEEKSVGGEEDDDWEGIERSELGEVFAAAAKYVASGGKDDRLSSMGSDVQMQLYGLHKVAMEGPCHEPQPMAIKISSRAKWNAWQRMGNMDPEVAREQYIALLSDKVPGWMEGKSSGDDCADSLESGIHAAPSREISTDLHSQHHSTKKRELEDYGADGGV
ncbi:acyl-CoA-binding domain-containing protein 5-like [Rhododendron vialii]|uniref:acyl-CoA-binding domain-containing protein 5-like n=1 Tax=Rhododendron vialii TaxID=182163 RepID=UPI00265DDDFA|nr:acyl-CoA-binding domain-containing protein 5-like [Rhododendron vialii]